MYIRHRLWVACLILSPATPAFAAPATLDELEACVQGNRPTDSSLQVVVLRSKDRMDHVSESRAKIYWKRFDDGLSRVMMRVSDPPAQRGSSVLLIEKKEKRADIFMFVPELKKVRRVNTRTVSASLFGTDFSFEDFERVQGYARDENSQLRTDQTLDGRSVVVVESRPAPESGSAYERTLTYFDSETCVPLRAELFEHGDSPRKVLTADVSKIEEHEGRQIPRSILMVDVRDSTQTELVVEELELDAKIKRKMFSVTELERGGH